MPAHRLISLEITESSTKYQTDIDFLEASLLEPAFPLSGLEYHEDSSNKEGTLIRWARGRSEEHCSSIGLVRFSLEIV